MVVMFFLGQSWSVYFLLYAIQIRIGYCLPDDLQTAHRSYHSWRRGDDPCWSRSERHLYHKASDIKASEAWNQRISAYAEIHSACTNPITNWMYFYKNPKSGRGVHSGIDVSNCKYLLWVPPTYAGLGNRLMSLTSAFLYALLTNRVLIVSDESTAAIFLCQPFPFSTWQIPESAASAIRRNAQRWFPRVGEYHQLVMNNTLEFSKTVIINLKYSCTEPDWKFFCSVEQETLTRATFGLFITEEYVVPGLYLVPKFREQMDLLFPDGVVFPHLARHLLLPTNYLWDRITKIYHGHMARHDSIVGIQIRTFHAKDHNTNYRVLDCARNVTHYLPDFFTQSQWSARLQKMSTDYLVQQIVTDPNPKMVSVFVTSLRLHHYSFLKRAYTDGQPVDGSIVTFHYESVENLEVKDNKHQHQRAFVEIWLLSLGDKLLTSEFSSFGYVASGLAGIDPYEMNIAREKMGSSYDVNGRKVCSMGSREPCYLSPPAFLDCGGVKLEPHKVHRFVKKCPNIGVGLSLQLDAL